MVKHKELIRLSLAQVRTLLAPQMAEGMFGVDLADLPEEDEIPLLEALHGHGGTVADWRTRLEGICVALLDVNTAPIERLLRIPGLGVDEAQTLVDARPFLNMEEMGQEGEDLATIRQCVTPYVGHDGYLFVDKPAGRFIFFDVDLAEGVLVKQDAKADRAALMGKLDVVGLRGVLEEEAELLWLCHWKSDVLAVERPERLRSLKRSTVVTSVAPVLRDRQGQLRVPYPDRLDVMLGDGASDAVWERLTVTYGLTTVEQYLPHYRSLRVAAHPHDLGALYRTLRSMARDTAVRFVEPTYIMA